VPFSFLPDTVSLMDALDDFGDPTIGCAYDLANAHFIGEEPDAALDLIAKRLRLIHVSDTPRNHYRHAPIGQGSVDWAGLPGLVARCGYASPIVLEIISETPETDLCAGRSLLQGLAWNGAVDEPRHAS
jgi:sugar phosphate isomerase/epimerase